MPNNKFEDKICAKSLLHHYLKFFFFLKKNYAYFLGFSSKCADRSNPSLLIQIESPTLDPKHGPMSTWDEGVWMGLLQMALSL